VGALPTLDKISSSTFRPLVGGSFFFKVLFTPSLWPFSYLNLFTISCRWSRWSSFIHMMETFVFHHILFAFEACLPRTNMLLISVASLCSMASTFDHIFCFWSNLCSSCKNNLSFETWKVRCATKLLVTLRCTRQGVAYAKFHKASHTWQWNMGPIH